MEKDRYRRILDSILLECGINTKIRYKEKLTIEFTNNGFKYKVELIGGEEDGSYIKRAMVDLFSITTPDNVTYKVDGFRLKEGEFYIKEVNKYHPDGKIESYLNYETGNAKCRRILGEMMGLTGFCYGNIYEYVDSLCQKKKII